MPPHPAAITDADPQWSLRMRLRALAASATLCGAVIFAGEAAAQYYPAYPYVPGPYRAAPAPYDDDDLYDLPPPGRGPYRREAAPSPYETPPYRREAAPAPAPAPYDTGREPYDRRSERQAPPWSSRQDVERRPLPDPYASRAPADPAYQGRADDLWRPDRRPPGEIGIARPGEPGPGRPPQVAALPPADQPEVGAAREMPSHLKRQVVEYRTREPAGTIIIDTANTYLYLVLGNGQAMRYGIGVGREGFTWSGRERVSRMAEWPDWHPPADMIERQPYLPRFMAGGEANPLGARALYLGKTLYRIHGTNQPSTIGTFVSSGCIRLLNADIEDLYQRVTVGSQVVVLPGRAPASAAVQR
jgi:lipoprotein-anchoring transpeptidase ErfK/SrfK